MRLLALTLALTSTLLGCEKLAGEPCEVSGDGFTRRDPCSQVCVDWAITCPDGREVTPDECAGLHCSVDEDCPEGLSCLQIDSVPANARCMRAEVCGG
ncbi:MAG: hypothetical protein KC549_17120 [Myxococcales bacterium]|nr:hypothetical protein [Myxococcales bacterium]MCB9544305.1 hypothetical protein [Myxococcales bacterium]